MDKRVLSYWCGDQLYRRRSDKILSIICLCLGHFRHYILRFFGVYDSLLSIPNTNEVYAIHYFAIIGQMSTYSIA
ncbi:MAG: hypothetical protein UY39_C0023G0010 [Candidatus Kaiserbacteria bacterium GW2011_GWC2_49_12]|uniref:Uncharacterized protein n=3 Tax=Candidatus Kaiseribacteriota TaxID=1752734 RepID=A0A0G1WGE3_9BACT|nr:MAG: hypothetical protein UY39_C0023G0010 [Candidatus Kaiserbacteria bacterium GW2011_GWC2_49_12]KKW17868.1 MAG: hypothetical protein UY57_C0008G0020 [Candidatus Kaiserbacteria bacterium GW2011_GWB1_50_17]KKW18464.1 MAG: hypothetical protein UY59_C0005G0001 [Candidatus Kaiserbacteria bacterium GW2011_GWA1_50_28]